MEKSIKRISDSSVKKATGKSREEWFSILDNKNSSEKTHGEIAKWIYDNYKTGSWWSQMITVEYEKEKGMRVLHQKKKGFEVSISKTFNTPLSKLFIFFTDDKLRKKWLKEKSQFQLQPEINQ